jgi:hypothetical protein
MKIPLFLLHLFAGWLAGVAATLGLGLLWPAVFPAIVRVNHYYGAGPGLPLIFQVALVLASPAALVGGLVGGRLSKEGGRKDQIMMAAVGGAFLALPFGCWVLWSFTGF